MFANRENATHTRDTAVSVPRREPTALAIDHLRVVQRSPGNGYLQKMSDAADPECEGGAGDWGGGRSHAAATGAFMEARFGQIFADVRVCTGPDAHRAAARSRARAFTHGHPAFLRDGESERGHHLMAHDLTHLVHQHGGCLNPAASGSIRAAAERPTPRPKPSSAGSDLQRPASGRENERVHQALVQLGFKC